MFGERPRADSAGAFFALNRLHQGLPRGKLGDMRGKAPHQTKENIMHNDNDTVTTASEARDLMGTVAMEAFVQVENITGRKFRETLSKNKALDKAMKAIHAAIIAAAAVDQLERLSKADADEFHFTAVDELKSELQVALWSVKHDAERAELEAEAYIAEAYAKKVEKPEA